MEEWQEAVKALKGQDITATLYGLAKNKPVAFRQLLALVFEPNSLRVRTERRGRNWFGILESYTLTEAMQKPSVPFWNNVRGCV